jgi:hypothetical protein
VALPNHRLRRSSLHQDRDPSLLDAGPRRPTLFRMFPQADAFPTGYPPGLEYSSTLILVWWKPGFVQSDRHFGGSGSVGTLLRPLTSRRGMSVEYFVMFARV